MSTRHPPRVNSFFLFQEELVNLNEPLAGCVWEVFWSRTLFVPLIYGKITTLDLKGLKYKLLLF